MDTTLTLTVNNLWMMISTALVFFMHLGFSFLEIGLTRQKNTINILFKNFFIISVGLVLYAFVGFNLMYPASFWHGILPDYFVGLFGLESPMGEAGLDLSYNEGYTYWTDFLFQGMFAATAATIVSGAIAERAKLGSFFAFSMLYVGLAYPIIGSWKWGGGFLDEWGFYDFAGSTLVHSVGGWAALLYIAKLGARIGKFGKDGKPRAIPGHNIPFAAAGVLILWLGWFGFNGGSVLATASVDSANAVAVVFMNTNLAAAGGCIGALILAKLMFGKADLTMALKGCLAGLVAITAGPDTPSALQATIFGALGGLLVVLSITTLDKLKIDDPVGAISVHGVVGLLGLLLVPLTNDGSSFSGQVIGALTIFGWVFVTSFITFFVIKMVLGLRVSEEEEYEGSDLSECGMEAYPEFATTR